MDDCLFCKIIRGEIPSAKVYEDDHCYAFRDIHPQAPVHVLVVSKKHIADLTQTDEMNDAETAGILRGVRRVAELDGLKSFRVVSNCGPDACQSVPHLHLHVLGGRQMTEKMA